MAKHTVLFGDGSNFIGDDVLYPKAMSTDRPVKVGTPVDATDAAQKQTAAPFDAEYVVLALDSGLSKERVLTAGNSVTLVDNGAGSTVVFDTIQDIRTSAIPTFAGAILSGLVKNTTMEWDGSQLNEIVTNGVAAVNINFDGYNSGTTQFRNFAVYNGKRGLILHVDGADAYVGIGTNVPSGDLEIKKSLSGSTVKIIIRNTAAAADSNVEFQLVTGAATWSLKNNRADGVFSLLSDAGKGIWILPASGNVGIGTLTPDLTGYGGDNKVLTILGGATDKSGVVEIGVPHAVGAIRIGEVAFVNLNNTAATVGRAAVQGLRDGGNANTALLFYTQSAAGYSEKMRINRDGNVGIGTTDPKSDLHLSSTTSTNLIWSDTNAGGDGKNWDLVANDTFFTGRLINDTFDGITSWIIVERNGMTVTDVSFPNGNFGIGTASPSGTLEVDPGEIILDQQGRAAYITGNARSGLYTTNGGGSYPFDNAAHLVFQTASAAVRDIIFVTGTTPTNRMVITGGGDVGRNTTTPQTGFHNVGTTRLGDQATNYMAVSATGDTTWVGSGGLIFGSVYGNEIGYSTGNATQNLWYDISDATMDDGKLHGITHDGSGQVTVTEPGMYLAVYYAAAEVSVANKHIQMAFSINGTEILDGINHIEPRTANSQMPISGTAILDLADNDTVNMSIRTTDAGTPIINVDHLGFSLVQVGGT